MWNGAKVLLIVIPISFPLFFILGDRDDSGEILSRFLLYYGGLAAAIYFIAKRS
jgi:hypothetical protein